VRAVTAVLASKAVKNRHVLMVTPSLLSRFSGATFVKGAER